MGLGHFLLGFRDPHHKNSCFGQWFRLLISFALFTVLLALWDVSSDVIFIVGLWWHNGCAIAIPWLIFITAVPVFPVVSSLVKGGFAQHENGAKAAFWNWRLARQKLIQSEERLLSTRAGEKVEVQEPPFLKNCCREAVCNIVDIFPISFFRRCVKFVQAWKNAPQSVKHYSYNKDIEFQDMQLQKAQLTEIKYESSPQLIILLLLIGTGLFPLRSVWYAALASFFSIAKYFPSSAKLPGKCAFNNRIYLEKDSISLSEANKLLKPRLFSICGTFMNFFYIICRYHLIISLTVYNWVASLMVTGIHCAIVTVFLIGSYRQSYRQESHTGKQKLTGRICAFITQLLTTLGYFLLVPVTTTMTTMGCLLATILQLVAAGVYALLVHVEWRKEIHCRDSDIFHAVVPRSVWFYGLLAGNVVLSLLLPVIHYVVNLCTDSTLWLRHRKDCFECAEFAFRYCYHRPCWLCEWVRCHEEITQEEELIAQNAQQMLPLVESIHSRVPVEFLEKSLVNEQSRQIAALIASVYKGAKGDFLLCTEHTNQLSDDHNQAVDSVTMAHIELRIANHDSPVVELSDSMEPESVAFSGDLRTSMHTFLRALYSEKFLYKKLAYQLFFKSKFYDKGIVSRDEQDAYWAEVKQLRNAHVSCGKHCRLKVNRSEGSKKLKLEIKPDGLPGFDWRLDRIDSNGSVVPDDMEYEYFNDENVLSIDDAKAKDQPVQECPLKEYQGRI
ncbi:uncharacterized protein LOC129594539 [Paramacrobiotus metropolitanus]|uniref:uncharacterized protein LOC129594539 n=1 Tax=Paramacrobiotus metropolitanus TaxID=2943436 RepID=UPI00244569EC|nr:uncharacterized protein LOC129594539 [Paramacrobiotus metropolitanus]